MRTIQNFINGQFVDADASEFTKVNNPATGEQTAQTPLTSKKQVQEAIEAAHNAFASWSQVSIMQRAQVLFAFRELIVKNLDRLALQLSSEHGKTFDDAKAEVGRGLEVVEFACAMPHHLKGNLNINVGSAVDAYNMRQPLGVCTGITPFNFPGMIPLWMAPMAIACGNTFVLKPADPVPSTSLILAELWKQAGLPDGVFNIVNGTKDVVEEFCDNPLVAAVSFVGSSQVAEIVYKRGTGNGKRVQALGAAKNHAIIMPDADLEFTANNIMGAAFGSAGERCMALPVVVCVGDDIADKFIDLIKPQMAAIKIGQFDMPGVEMGPLISEQHKARVENYIRIGQEEDKADLVVDGRGVKVAGLDNGYFVGPTLFDNVKEGMTIHSEEIFGPVLGIIRAKTYDEALAIINRHAFGNGSCIFTRDGNAARLFTQNVQAGMIGINVPIPAPSALYSFGGWKASLFGDHHMYGEEGVRFFTRLKVVTSRWPAGVPAGENAYIMPS